MLCQLIYVIWQKTHSWLLLILTYYIQIYYTYSYITLIKHYNYNCAYSYPGGDPINLEIEWRSIYSDTEMKKGKKIKDDGSSIVKNNQKKNV